MDHQDISEPSSTLNCRNLTVVVGYYLLFTFSVVGFVEYFSVFVC